MTSMNSIQLDPQGFVDILTDPQTSLLQRDYFLLRLEEEFKKSWRYGWVYSLIVFDVEELDDVKANSGENAWAAALLAIAGEILSASRDIDLSTRLEDGRFMVLLPGSDAEGTTSFVKRVLQGQLGERLAGRFTVSVGGTVMPQSGLDQMDEFIARADTALLKARSMGTGELVLWNQAAE